MTNERKFPSIDPTMTLARGRRSAERFLTGIDRLAAWSSAMLLFLFIVSGFGMTNPELVGRMSGGLFTWRVAYDLHTGLNIPLMVVFTMHTFLGIRRMLIRSTRRRRTASWVAAGLGAAVLAFLLTLGLAPSVA